MHIFGGSFSNPYTSLFFTGLVLANLCFYFGLVLLYYLARAHFGPTVAKDALFFLAIGPYALFFFIGYSESLFLLLSLAIFFFLHRGRTLDWWLAGLCGFLAALTRATGIVLAIPFLVILIQRFWPYQTSLAYSLAATTKCYSSYDINSTWPPALHDLSLHHHGRPACI